MLEVASWIYSLRIDGFDIASELSIISVESISFFQMAKNLVICSHMISLLPAVKMIVDA